jgi:hypothetical protein
MQVNGLKLKATDDDDLEVFSTVLQDAPMPLSEVTFLKEERRFAALFRRFCYEQVEDAVTGSGLMQVECALVFDEVANASAWDLGGLGGDGLAELMTIVSDSSGESGVTITLVFHGGGHIRVEAEKVAGRLADLGDAQPADRRPRHTPLFEN